jgi:hypothetical protein
LSVLTIKKTQDKTLKQKIHQIKTSRYELKRQEEEKYRREEIE